MLLGLFSVQLCNHAVKSGYQISPPPLIFLRIIINFIQCQIQGFKIALVESKFVSKNLSSKFIILQDMPPTSLA